MKIGSRETGEMLEWFNTYLKMGSDRSLEKLSKITGKNPKYHEAISAKFKWAERVNEIEREAAEKAIELTKENLMKSKLRNLRIIQAAAGRFAQALNQNKVKLTAADFEKMARLELLIRGEADQRHGFEENTLAAAMKRAYERRTAKKSN